MVYRLSLLGMLGMIAFLDDGLYLGLTRKHRKVSASVLHL